MVPPLPNTLAVPRQLGCIEDPEYLLSIGFDSSMISSSKGNTLYFADIIINGERHTLVYTDHNLPKELQGKKLVTIHADCEAVARFQKAGILENKLDEKPSQISVTRGTPGTHLTDRFAYEVA